MLKSKKGGFSDKTSQTLWHKVKNVSEISNKTWPKSRNMKQTHKDFMLHSMGVQYNEWKECPSLVPCDQRMLSSSITQWVWKEVQGLIQVWPDWSGVKI